MIKLSTVFNVILGVLKIPLEKTMELVFEPFWEFLVNHDKYVYLGLSLIILLGICL